MKLSHIKFIKINQLNMKIFKNLAQAYEAEFSLLTDKMPDANGLFKIDILPKKPCVGFLVYYKTIPVGFCVIDIHNDIKDISEFYIVPAMRKMKLGSHLAYMVFDKFPGNWQVRQLMNAKNATHFWRVVIGKYTNNRYSESIMNDAHWGKVICQQFKNFKS